MPWNFKLPSVIPSTQTNASNPIACAIGWVLVDAHRGIVDEYPCRVHVQRGPRRPIPLRQCTQDGAFRAEDVDHDVRGVDEHFLLVGELLSVRLHGEAEHHQRGFLERVHGPSLVG